MTALFRWPLILTALTLVIVWYWAGVGAALLVAILAVLEISLSFDNAVVNAKILGRMSPAWQKLFLSLGIIIAVFGMRLVFPLAIVSLAAQLGPAEVVHLALAEPATYAQLLQQAHPAIAAFGGLFLLMLFTDFIIVDRSIKWLRGLEAGLARAGRLENLTVMVALAALLAAAGWLAGNHALIVLAAGGAGILVYLAVTSLTSLFEVGNLAEAGARPRAAQVVARAGVFSFIYLEVLDASFSFDGVIGAFALTNQIFLIAAGLGIGALFVRSLTVALVRHQVLSRYVFLEHGAHYAIGALAVILLLSLHYEVPQAVTGLVGVAFIAVSFLDSREYSRRHPPVASGG